MAFSPDQLSAALARLPAPGRWWVALSGGLDSTALLHALVSTAPGVPIHAVHINHQLSPNADAWAAHCQALCERLGVPLTLERVQVIPTGKGIEEAARAARYSALARCLAPGDCLLTGHHAEDQAETLLLRLLRGTGLRGLAGIVARRPLGAGQLARPLLAVPRQELEAYVAGQGFTWVEDESNQDTRYDRNYLRCEVMPRLSERWPGFARRWQQTAQHLAEADALLAELAAEDLAKAQPAVERLGHSLSVSSLQALTPARQRNLLRFWLQTLGTDSPEQAHLAAIETQVLAGRNDSEAQVRWGSYHVCRYRERLYCLGQSVLPGTPQAGECVPILPGSMALPNGGYLHVSREVAGPEPEWLQADLPDLHLRWRQGGERCRPARRGHSQTLKKLLQEASLEPWLRASLPLVYSGEQLVAVGDLWVCAGFAALPGQSGYRLHWYPGADSESREPVGGEVFD